MSTRTRTWLALASVNGTPPAGVVALRYRYRVWQDAPDCCLEDLFVYRRHGLDSFVEELGGHNRFMRLYF